MLQIESLTAGYGAGIVIEAVSIALECGKIIALTGQNGVGKTTLLRALMGQTTIRSGDIVLDGQSLRPLASFERAKAGLAYVPQGRGIFGQLTVADNVRLGEFGQRSSVGSRVNLSAMFPIVRERSYQRAGTLSGGEQQQLAIARALASSPSFLLLDEPSEGIQPSILDTIGNQLASLAREHSIGVLLVEQNLDFAIEIADRLLVMERGRIVTDLDGTAMRADPRTLMRNYGI